jgi:hypothetical protein
MTRNEALEILEETRKDYTQKQRIFRGLQILAKYDDNLQFAFEHDQVFVADFDLTVEKMVREEVVELATCGWFLSEDSWSHFA